jgi:hypothetical protein
MSIYDFVFFGPLVKTCGTHVRTACDVQSRDLFPSRDTQLYGKALSPLKATALCMGVVLLPECRWCRHLSAVLHAGGGAAYVQFCMGWCRWLCVAVFSETNQVADTLPPLPQVHALCTSNVCAIRTRDWVPPGRLLCSSFI